MSDPRFVRAWPQAQVSARLYTTRYAVAMFDQAQCRRILDVGCGDAYFEERYPERFVGMDIEMPRLRLAHERGVQLLVLGSADHLPYAPECFDGVLMKDVLEHFYLEAAFHILHEVSRVLKPGGTLIVTTTKNVQSFWDKPDHVRPYSNKWVKRVLVDELNLYKLVAAQELSGGIRGFGRLGLEWLTHALANRCGFRNTHGILTLRRA